MFNAILRHVVPLPKPDAFSRYLFIGPHPDDIEVACAPTVKRLTDAGKDVRFLVMTDGGGGTCDPVRFKDTLVATRRREATASAALLGVSDVTFLDLPDGGPFSEWECAKRIAEAVVRLKPDAVFAPDPDVRSECHLDHLTVGRAAKSVLLQTPFLPIVKQYGLADTHEIQALFLYYTDRPNALLPVSRTYGARMAALRLHESQFTPDMLSQVELYYRLRSLRLACKSLRGKCDGYRALAPVHMHCFPEASRW